MKKSIAAGLSLVFMFGIFLLAVILLGVLVNKYLWFLLFVYEFAAIIVAFSLIFSKRRLDVKIRWALFLIMVPVIGLFSFLFFGKGYPQRVIKKYAYKNIHLIDEEKRNAVVKNAKEVLEVRPQYERSFMIGVNQQSDLPYDNSDAKFFPNAALGWIQIIKDLREAKKYILINYYIIEDGDLWRNVKRVLERKVKEGVKIYIIFDFIGSYGTFTYTQQEEIMKMGIKVVPYNKMNLPFLNWKSNYRDHRKDISIDGKIGYIGGANLGDEYINLSPEYGMWNDASVRITGDGVLGIEKIFVSDWKYVTGKDLLKDNDMIAKNFTVKPVKQKEELVQIDASGPNHKNPGNLDILMNIISTAQKRVWLSTPYFVPPTELVNLIASTARSGVDVRLVLPGMTDKFMLLDVSKKHTDVLFDSGVKIYSTNKMFNHTKAYLIDDDLSFTGSTNLDYRALFSDQQSMGLIYSKKFNKELEKRFENDFRISKLYKTKPSKEHNALIRFFILLFNWAAPLL